MRFEHTCDRGHVSITDSPDYPHLRCNVPAYPDGEIVVVPKGWQPGDRFDYSSEPRCGAEMAECRVHWVELPWLARLLVRLNWSGTR